MIKVFRGDLKRIYPHLKIRIRKMKKGFCIYHQPDIDTVISIKYLLKINGLNEINKGDFDRLNFGNYNANTYVRY